MGAIVFPLGAGFLVTVLDWQHSLVVGGSAALGASALFFLIREPERGRWDRLAITGSDAPPAAPVKPVSFSEALRTVQSVRTLRRVCLAEAFLSASGVLAIPLLTATMIRVYGTDPLLIGVISSSGFVSNRPPQVRCGSRCGDLSSVIERGVAMGEGEGQTRPGRPQYW